MTPQHFLVPLDFSPYSTQALDYAMALAHKLHARLTLLHVMQSLAMSSGDMDMPLPSAFMQELDIELNRSLESYLARVTAAGLNGERVLKLGGSSSIKELLRPHDDWQRAAVSGHRG